MAHKVTAKQHNSRMCFVCGLKNSSGLHASFYEVEGDQLVALFTPCEEHQGYPDRLHGGLAATILDETIGRAMNINNDEIWGVTVEFSVRYKKPVPLDQELRVVGRITKQNRRLFEGTGEILLPTVRWRWKDTANTSNSLWKRSLILITKSRTGRRFLTDDDPKRKNRNIHRV